MSPLRLFSKRPARDSQPWIPSDPLERCIWFMKEYEQRAEGESPDYSDLGEYLQSIRQVGELGTRDAVQLLTDVVHTRGAVVEVGLAAEDARMAAYQLLERRYPRGSGSDSIRLRDLMTQFNAALDAVERFDGGIYEPEGGTVKAGRSEVCAFVLDYVRQRESLPGFRAYARRCIYGVVHLHFCSSSSTSLMMGALAVAVGDNGAYYYVPDPVVVSSDQVPRPENEKRARGLSARLDKALAGLSSAPERSWDVSYGISEDGKVAAIHRDVAGIAKGNAHGARNLVVAGCYARFKGGLEYDIRGHGSDLTLWADGRSTGQIVMGPSVKRLSGGEYAVALPDYFCVSIL